MDDKDYHYYVETNPYKGCGKCGFGPGARQHNSHEVLRRTPFGLEEFRLTNWADEPRLMASIRALQQAQDEISNLKKDRDHWRQARENAMAAGEIMKQRLDAAISAPVAAATEKWTESQLNIELEWLRFYKKEVYTCLGPGDSEIVRDIKRAYLSSGKQLPLTDPLEE